MKGNWCEQWSGYAWNPTSFFAINLEDDSISSFLKKIDPIDHRINDNTAPNFCALLLNFVGQIVDSCNAADIYSVGSCLLIVVMH